MAVFPAASWLPENMKVLSRQGNGPDGIFSQVIVEFQPAIQHIKHVYIMNFRACYQHKRWDECLDVVKGMQLNIALVFAEFRPPEDT